MQKAFIIILLESSQEVPAISQAHSNKSHTFYPKMESKQSPKVPNKNNLVPEISKSVSKSDLKYESSPEILFYNKRKVSKISEKGKFSF